MYIHGSQPDRQSLFKSCETLVILGELTVHVLLHPGKLVHHILLQVLLLLLQLGELLLDAICLGNGGDINNFGHLGVPGGILLLLLCGELIKHGTIRILGRLGGLDRLGTGVDFGHDGYWSVAVGTLV